MPSKLQLACFSGHQFQFFTLLDQHWPIWSPADCLAYFMLVQNFYCILSMRHIPYLSRGPNRLISKFEVDRIATSYRRAVVHLCYSLLIY